ncbi:hypothetical protein BZA05DRAFT_445167 [Tricharina praecox]|uniref:uncharacterized protein n=1 Tax=Tricharina praecox TaxID=43433 RepID=UPI0022201001|nr:uncharacterized protein BZA05DRAFT_445167 [Tricharina praecox]KAI5852002.1 hypothetical protein BZA05DRAFT_445167 [Tricharina praecox]
MSATSNPITPQSFLIAIADLQLDQLHAESARLHNSIYHLERSNNALEEFPSDEDCRAALRENMVTIGHQQERVQLIKEEVERRGFLMPCGEKKEEQQTNGVGGSGGGGTAANGNRAEENGLQTEEEEGVYL